MGLSSVLVFLCDSHFRYTFTLVMESPRGLPISILFSTFYSPSPYALYLRQQGTPRPSEPVTATLEIGEFRFFFFLANASRSLTDFPFWLPRFFLGRARTSGTSAGSRFGRSPRFDGRFAFSPIGQEFRSSAEVTKTHFSMLTFYLPYHGSWPPSHVLISEGNLFLFPVSVS